MLEHLGHHVEPAAPDIDGIALAHDFLRIWFAQLAVQISATREQWRGRDFELDSLAMEAIAKARSATDYAASYVRWGEYGFQLSEFLTRYDVYIDADSRGSRAPDRPSHHAALGGGIDARRHAASGLPGG